MGRRGEGEEGVKGGGGGKEREEEGEQMGEETRFKDRPLKDGGNQGEFRLRTFIRKSYILYLVSYIRD